ncbi:Fe-S protein assembly co-chaperone HscB [Agaribacter flavus]|uniref:Co-chaperone protein HscB homolog n=1 Tax=Agaribacter flavus TaxID=1902781 RepID=A0ABV7FRK8_9ALTE
MTNYFTLFNIPVDFNVDLVALKSKYQTLQKLTHPDRFVNASDQEKRLYMQKNAQINDAYHVLTSPVKRGEHILQVRGFSLVDENATLGDNSFLMQQMLLREQLQDAHDAESFSNFELELTQITADLCEQVETALAESNDNGNKKAADALTKLKFLIKLSSEADARREQILT